MKDKSKYVPLTMLMPVFLIAVIPSVVQPQSFRGEVTAHRVVDTAASIQSTLEAGQVLLIDIDSEFPFVEGLLIRVIPPDDIAIPPGAFSVAVYGQVDPAVAETRGFTTLGGREAGTRPLGISGTENASRGETIQVGLHPEFAGSGDFQRIDPTLGAVAIQVVPVMKGMSAGLENATFRLEVDPIIREEGVLEITVTGETPDVRDRAHEELKLHINDIPIEPDRRYFFDPGIYRLTADAGDYLQHQENIGIEIAHITTLTLQAREPRAYLRVQVPSVADVFVDGVRLERTHTPPIEHPPGSYMLLIRLGDFSISRRLVLEANEEYDIGLDLDILIKQN